MHAARVVDARTRERLGTAWSVGPDDTTLVTCAHVVAAATGRPGDVLVLDADAGRPRARACALVGVRPGEDLAVLWTAGAGGPADVPARDPEPGERAAVVLADGPRRCRVVARPRPGSVDVHGLRAPLAAALHLVDGRWVPGDSGSPVVAADGTLLGVLVASSTAPPRGVVVGGRTVGDAVRALTLRAAGALAGAGRGTG